MQEKTMRRIFVCFICALLFMSGCAGKENPPTTGGTGLPGRYSEEAELLFAKAHVLWKGDTCAEPLEAVRLLDEVIRIEPGYGAAWARRGLAHSELGNREEAFDDLTQAVRLEPTAEHYAHRALISLRGGALAAARRDLDYSLKKDQKQHRARNLLGMLLLREGDAAGACASFADGCSNGDCEPLQTARKEGRCI